jgi:hypothetical protein
VATPLDVMKRKLPAMKEKQFLRTSTSLRKEIERGRNR